MTTDIFRNPLLSSIFYQAKHITCTVGGVLCTPYCAVFLFKFFLGGGEKDCPLTNSGTDVFNSLVCCSLLYPVQKCCTYTYWSLLSGQHTVCLIIILLSARHNTVCLIQYFLPNPPAICSTQSSPGGPPTAHLQPTYSRHTTQICTVHRNTIHYSHPSSSTLFSFHLKQIFQKSISDQQCLLDSDTLNDLWLSIMIDLVLSWILYRSTVWFRCAVDLLEICERCVVEM